VVAGDNGEGKTSLLEAIGWGALGRSFRGVPDAALVRTGAPAAILRLAVDAGDGDHHQTIEAELRAAGRNRVLLNRNPIVRTRDLLGVLRITVFSPDDLDLVKGGPAGRRDYLDDLLVAMAPRYAAVRAEVDKVTRHRNALLKGGIRDEEARTTLEVFDDQLVASGAELARGRLRLVTRLAPGVDEAYRALAGDERAVTARYDADWIDGDWIEGEGAALDAQLREALAARRRQEIDRGVTLVGPHRDEWRLTIGGFESRTHASQGEQRTLALALRLAGHRVSTDLIGDEPVLLLDDVFSELDASRTAALVEHLGHGQTLLTTAGEIPAGVEPTRRLRVRAGRIEPA